mmetsp:Transcript_26421/g.60886  ORF Transcript_26421/g.60886 Transcript_26421/m.60886 type:complete len:120 (-) Transcript_26421:229-588(-)
MQQLVHNGSVMKLALQKQEYPNDSKSYLGECISTLLDHWNNMHHFMSYTKTKLTIILEITLLHNFLAPSPCVRPYMDTEHQEPWPGGRYAPSGPSGSTGHRPSPFLLLLPPAPSPPAPR